MGWLEEAEVRLDLSLGGGDAALSFASFNFGP